MVVKITMPQLSDTMHDGTILKWIKEEGEIVKKGDILAEVGTDKADLEIECYHDGHLLKHYAQVGQKIPVGQTIAIIGNKGENIEDDIASNTNVTETNITVATLATTPISTQNTHPTDHTHSLERNPSERIKISPLAKNLAKQHNIDYSNIKGTGDNGRIVKQDIEDVIINSNITNSNATSPNIANQKIVTSTQPSSMRKTIASRMLESKTTIPHFYMTTRIDVEALLHSQKALKETPSYKDVTVTHFIIRAVSLCLRDIPQLNDAYINNSIAHHSNINIGIVTAIEGGLLVPVIKDADKLPFSDLVSESNAIIQRARTGKPQANDLLGATFSISNVGKYDIESFSAIIAPGQSAILAASSIIDEPIVRGGQVVPAKVQRFSLSVDHRMVDGVLAASFLSKLKHYLENPILLLA